MSQQGTDSGPRPPRDGAPDRALREQHNPIWAVTDDRGTVHQVYACDELQAERYALDVLRIVVIAVWRASD